MVQLLEIEIIYGVFTNKETPIEVLKVKLTKEQKKWKTLYPEI